MPTGKSGDEVPARLEDSVLTLESLEPRDGMYRKEFSLDGSLRHSRQCRAMFNRRDWKCPRCLELLRGALPREGWMTEFVEARMNGSQRKLPF